MRQAERSVDLTYDTSKGGNGNRERVAWAILLVSFVVWLILVLAVPVGVSSFLQNASRPLVLLVQANEGTVGLTTPQGQRDAIFVGEPARRLEGKASVLTSTTDTALVNVYTPDESEALARLQIYANTGLDVTSARAPRFGLSNNDHELRLSLTSGRLRISLPVRDGRPTVVRVSTPQNGEVLLEQAGEYSFDVTNAATSVVVLEGAALIRNESSELPLQINQRGLIPAEGQLTGPLDSERNLVRNGNFDEDLKGWTPLTPTPGDEAQSAADGTMSVLQVDGETLLRFLRVGQGPYEMELQQVVNQDVTDFASLELHVTMRIVDQSLGVCGVQGSECPLFVRITYIDVHGAEQVWQQGFYSTGEIVAGSTPDICQFCATPRIPHVRVPQNQVYFFESGNLQEKLAQQNIAPRFIERISLVASGHSFETQVIDVGLIANE